MKGFWFLTILFLGITPNSFSKEEKKGWGLSLGEGTSNIRIGGRLQGIGSYNTGNGFKDLYLRRARVNLQYQTQNFHMIYVELRNDNSTREDRGEGSLFIGDAFYEIPLDIPFIYDLTLFRSKVDVSYSQTSSSKNLIHPNRSRVSDYAANFVVHNRRANNIQINGGNDWMTYQLVISDGIQNEEVEEAFGNVTVSAIAEQKLTVGAKARFFLWGEKAELQETFYGAKRTLSFGLGAFTNSDIRYTLSNGQEVSHSRSLYNAELSFAYDNFRLLAEGLYFQGDTLNPSQRRFGDAWGTYMRSEYILGKIAPYIGLSYLKRDKDNSNTQEASQLIGVNYYAENKTRRYGVSFQNFEYGNLLSSRNKKEVMTYIMMDY
jgi:hypothetical protein